MALLFSVRPERVTIYTERLPGADGRGASALTALTIASSVFLVIVGVVPVWAALTNDAIRGALSRFGIPPWVFLFFAVCGFWNLTGEFRAVVFDAGRRKLFVRGRFGRRLVADFSAIAEVRLFESEDEDGAKAYQYGAVFVDAGRAWYPVTPKVYEEPQRAVFRDVLIPRVEALVFADGAGAAVAGD